MKSFSSAGPVPTFWFAVYSERGAFDQLAAAMRKRGYRTVRLVAERPSRLVRAVERLVYDRVVTLDDLRAGRDGPREDERVVDLQWTETMSQEMDDAALRHFPAELVATLASRRPLAHNRTVADRLQQAGIEVAPHLDADEVADAEAIAAFGLPIVVKKDISAAASGVRIARTADELAAAVEELGPDRSLVFFQKLLPGEVLNYAGIMASDSTPIQEVGYLEYGQTSGGHRPGREVRDDPELRAYGRAVCAALGIVGPVDMEAVRHEGTLRLIDLNFRPWGTMLSLRAAGLDLDSGYAFSTGVTQVSPSSRTAQVGARFYVFPDEIDQLSAERGPLVAGRRLVQRIPTFGNWLGIRYLAHVIALRVMLRLEGTATGPGLPTHDTPQEGTVPTFWFAVDIGWTSPFDQLAAAMRKRGYRTVRLVAERPSRLVRAVERLVYDRVVTLDDLRAGRDGPREDERVVDLQWVETMSEAMDDAALRHFPAELVATLDSRRPLGHNRTVADRLQQAGIEVAPHLDADKVTDAEAIAAFGLPIVVKRDISAAASGVRIARTADELAAAVEELGPDRASVFFQKLLPGEWLNYAGIMAADGSPIQEVGYLEYGQAGGHRPGREVVDDPELHAYGRAVCAALGIVGPVDMEAVRHEGTLRLIDLNFRPWGTMLSLRAAGLDLDSGYAFSTGVTQVPPRSRTARVGARFNLFPAEIDQLSGERGLLVAGQRLVQRIPTFGRWLGMRYLAYVVAVRVSARLKGTAAGPGLPTHEASDEH